MLNGWTVDAVPKISKMLKVFEPMTLPSASSELFLREAIIEVMSSGREVPIATMVIAITASLTPQARAKFSAEERNRFPPPISPVREAIAIRMSRGIGLPESLDSASSSSLRNDTSSSSVAVSSSSISRRDILGPTKVSKVYSIDEMKGQYKSPRKALFFSLVIPGSGQLYVGGSTFNYVRGAAYLAIEGALWGGWYYYSVHKYNKQVKRYKKFAKNHYSAYTYESKIHDLYNSLDDSDEEAEFIERYLSNRETYCKSIYGNASTNGCYVEGKELTNDKNHTNHVNGSFSLYNSGSYYSTIAGAAYVLGWDDVEDEAAASALNLSDNDAETVALGTSTNWKTYRSMRNKANDYADMQAWFFGGLILNHIVSALDAAWSAHSHNKVLYEEELSWYDKLHFEGGFIPMNSQSMVNVYFNF